MSESQQYCTFRLEEHWLGIPVEQVQEVLQSYELTPVPLAAEAVLGLINLRGQIVMSIDMRRRLNLPESEHQHQGANMIVQAADELVGFVVDEVGDVRRVSQSQFEPLPETVTDQSRVFMTGCYKLADHLLLVLDIEKAAAMG